MPSSGSIAHPFFELERLDFRGRGREKEHSKLRGQPGRSENGGGVEDDRSRDFSISRL